MLFTCMLILYIMHPWEIYTTDWLNFGYSDMDFEKEKKLTVTFKKSLKICF